MNKKIKKKIDIIQQRLQILRQKLAGAKKQNDEPGEVEQLEADIAKLETELKELKKS